MVKLWHSKHSNKQKKITFFWYHTKFLNKTNWGTFKHCRQENNIVGFPDNNLTTNTWQALMIMSSDPIIPVLVISLQHYL